MIENLTEKYGVGALLYSPALNGKVADAVIHGKFGKPYSLALCLEDTVAEDSVEAAERQLAETVRRVRTAAEEGSFYLPKLFIRVRSCEQMLRLSRILLPDRAVVSGYIFPKYTLSNADAYNEAVAALNREAEKPVWMMPILESPDIVDYAARRGVLTELKKKIDSVKPFVLNIRVGGNDFSNEFSVRRRCDETIYDILPIAQLFGDILTVFSREYVVSGPVWEYFSGENGEWEAGLRRELKLDRLNGFVGKTVIHPKQIAVVNDALKVSGADYADAMEILNWDRGGLLVGKSSAGERMNEVRTHLNWARKTAALAEIYGVR